jgi:hypothetical protein
MTRTDTKVGIVRSAFVLALLTVAFAVSQGTAAAGGPTQVFAATCLGSGSTASWSHVRAESVVFSWFAGGIKIAEDTKQVSSKAPKGQVSVPTPAGAESLHVNIIVAGSGGGSGGTTTVSCNLAK